MLAILFQAQCANTCQEAVPLATDVIMLTLWPLGNLNEILDM